MNESHHHSFKVGFVVFKMCTPQEPNAHSYPALPEEKKQQKTRTKCRGQLNTLNTLLQNPHVGRTTIIFKFIAPDLQVR